MNDDLMNDPLLDVLGQLPSPQPDETRRVRGRTRCHAVLAARRAATARADNRGSFVALALAGAIAFYVLATLGEAATLIGRLVN